MSAEHEHFMAIAIEEAKRGRAAGEQPFGAVVARGGEVVCRTCSLKVSRSDVTAHSETLAVGMATQVLRTRTLTGCTFYCTCEPCPMCLGAILNGGIDHLVMGARNRDVARPDKLAFNFGDYTVERFAAMVGWNLKVVEGVLGDACIDLYRTAGVELTR
jgi:tRNA(adenine34) deaminase